MTKVSGHHAAAVVGVVAIWTILAIRLSGRTRSIREGETREAAQVDGKPAVCKWSQYADIAQHPLRSATKAEKILYIKVPKTGSSTVSSLLWRYARRHDMRMLKLASVHSEDEAVQAMSDANFDEVDVLASHLRYDTRMVGKFLGGSAFRIASVRDPLSRLYSAFGYAWERHVKRPGKGSWVCEKKVEDFRKWASDCTLRSQQDYMAPLDWRERDRLDLDKVVEHYDHFMVTELMTESMIVLASKIDMTLAELLLLSKKTESGGYLEDNVPVEDREEFKRLLAERGRYDSSILIDAQLHKRAAAILQSEFEGLPEKVRNMAADLKLMTEEVNEACAEDRSTPTLSDTNECVVEWVSRNVLC